MDIQENADLCIDDEILHENLKERDNLEQDTLNKGLQNRWTD